MNDSSIPFDLASLRRQAMKTECVLLQIGDDAEFGILVPNWAAEHLGEIVANASVVRTKVPEIVDVPVILKSYGYAIEEEDD